MSKLEHREEMRRVIPIMFSIHRQGEYLLHFLANALNCLYLYMLYRLTHIYIYFLSSPCMKYSNLP